MVGGTRSAAGATTGKTVSGATTAAVVALPATAATIGGVPAATAIAQRSGSSVLRSGSSGATSEQCRTTASNETTRHRCRSTRTGNCTCISPGSADVRRTRCRTPSKTVSTTTAAAARHNDAIGKRGSADSNVARPAAATTTTTTGSADSADVDLDRCTGRHAQSCGHYRTFARRTALAGHTRLTGGPLCDHSDRSDTGRHRPGLATRSRERLGCSAHIHDRDRGYDTEGTEEQDDSGKDPTSSHFWILGKHHRCG